MARNNAKQNDWQECRRYFLELPERDASGEGLEEAEAMLALIGKLMARRAIRHIQPSVDGGVLRLVIPYAQETLVVLAARERYIVQSPDAAADPHFELELDDIDAVVDLVTAYDAIGFSAERAWRAIENRLASERDALPSDGSADKKRSTLSAQIDLARTLCADDRLARFYPTRTRSSLRLSPAPTSARRPRVTLRWKSDDVHFVALEGPGHGARLVQRTPHRHQVADTVLRLLQHA